MVITQTWYKFFLQSFLTFNTRVCIIYINLDCLKLTRRTPYSQLHFDEIKVINSLDDTYDVITQ